mmetsp:Transcript_29746/g.50421  ORF Transcript_29746/g.50421 Transcript_29746/m.50421 type:complete len:119 (-) Transcript_29746:32-388(-)
MVSHTFSSSPAACPRRSVWHRVPIWTWHLLRQLFIGRTSPCMETHMGESMLSKSISQETAMLQFSSLVAEVKQTTPCWRLQIHKQTAHFCVTVGGVNEWIVREATQSQGMRRDFPNLQ